MSSTITEIILYNLHEMLSDRNISIPIESLSTSSTIINNKLLLLFIEEKLSLKTLKELGDQNASNGIFQIILILKEKPSPSCFKLINELKLFGTSQNINSDQSQINQPIQSQSLFIEYFTFDELMYNPTHHIYVPKHILLNEVQKLEVLKKFRCSESELPKILESDRIARYYGAKKGDVFKIIRSSKEGKQDFYRLVVESKNIN